MQPAGIARARCPVATGTAILAPAKMFPLQATKCFTLVRGGKFARRKELPTQFAAAAQGQQKTDAEGDHQPADQCPFGAQTALGLAFRDWPTALAFR